jgi:CDP-4-dehydro-6-deoxyglucose reductase
MSFHVRWLETGDAFEVERGETVLGAALRAGVALPHDCQLGGCGSCRVRLLDGSVAYQDDELPLALSPEEQAAGYALACQALPCSDLRLSVEPSLQCSPPARLTAAVEQVRPLTPEVLQLRLVLPEDSAVVYRPGQHLDVVFDDGSRRHSFSMASKPDGPCLDFHVRRIAGGRFTDAALARLKPGDALEIELPLGGFRYHEEDERPLLMVATGTGLAPLKAMLEALLDDDDCPPVSLYWGMRTAEDLYLHAQIESWAPRLYEFRYVPVLSRADAGWRGRRGHVQQAVVEDFDDLSEHSIYLCGSPEMIADAKAAFLARGASAEHLYAEGFSIRSG